MNKSFTRALLFHFLEKSLGRKKHLRTNIKGIKFLEAA